MLCFIKITERFPGYYFGFHLFGLLFFLPWIKGHSNLNGYVEDVGVSSTWW